VVVGVGGAMVVRVIGGVGVDIVVVGGGGCTAHPDITSSIKTNTTINFIFISSLSLSGIEIIIRLGAFCVFCQYIVYNDQDENCVISAISKHFCSHVILR
jgi:hypothetical protein